MIINILDIDTIDFSHIRCDGTVNCYIELKTGKSMELYGLTLRQSEALESMKSGAISIDERFFTQTGEQWLAQNGIRKGA